MSRENCPRKTEKTMTEQQQNPEPPDMILVPPAPDGTPRPEMISIRPEFAAELDADKK